MAEPTQARLHSLLHYDPETGIFRWIGDHNARARAGQIAGCRYQTGYIFIGIDGRYYGAHRLAWLYVHGFIPAEIDHRDGDGTNNRLVNLRECSHDQNQENRGLNRNNTSGLTGVYWDALNGKWVAQIGKNGKRYRLGRHITKEQAHQAYLSAKERLHKFQPVPRWFREG